MSSAESGVLEGSWQSAFWVHLPFPVSSKSNYRRGDSASWVLERQLRAAVAAVVRDACPPNWPVGDSAVAVKARPATLSLIVARSSLDAGNISKSILDALEGTLYVSDAQVAAEQVAVDRVSSGGCADLCFAAVAIRPPATELVSLSAELAAAWKHVREGTFGTCSCL